MKKINPKQILLALVIGLGLTFISLIYAQQRTVILNDCDGLCTLQAPMYAEVTDKGFPLQMTRTQNGLNDYADTSGFNIQGILGNWLLYSAIAYILILIWQRKPRLKKVLG